MLFVSFFFFNDTATTEIYTYGHTLSLHDSLPIFKPHLGKIQLQQLRPADVSSWLQKLVASGNLSTRSIRHAHGVLSTALRHAAAIEIVERSVASNIKPPALQIGSASCWARGVRTCRTRWSPYT